MMSNATLSPPRSSSTAPSGEDGNRSDSSNSELDSDTSLIQLTNTASRIDGHDNLESKGDGKQKRKRTSPKDQAILEAEYKENPKPNKAARAVIVEKIDMNEKEVQIWFQNRRQITRRKSRPLLPHEIMAFGVGGIAALSSDPAFTNAPPTGNRSSEDAGTESEQDKVAGGQANNTTNSEELETLEDTNLLEESVPQIATDESHEPGLPSSIPSFVPSLKSQNSAGITTEASSFTISESVIKSFSSTPGYLANRWNAVHSFSSTPSSSQNAASLATPSISFPSLQFSCPERIGGSESSLSASKVRLSMSIDGKAELVETLSSPPRPQAPRPSSSGSSMPQQRRGLQRSQSARQPNRISSTGQFVPRLPSGRSRDARAWEFCCDPHAQDELTTQATNESTGSAVAAISLLRSTSKSVLKPNTNKRNTPSVKQDSNVHGKKPKLGRAMSSLARLGVTQNETFKASKGNTGKDGLMGSPSGDSDKENWLPGEVDGHPRHRPFPPSRNSQHSKAILGENNKIVSHAVGLGGSKNKRRKAAYVGPEIFEDVEIREPGEEVEKFMRGEVSPSKKGDYNAIQGLLSLSQGNWR